MDIPAATLTLTGTIGCVTSCICSELSKKKTHRKGAGREVSPLSFHSLRRAATTLLHEAGIPAAVAQALIGHDSAAIHEIYISVGREALEKAAAALPEL